MNLILGVLLLAGIVFSRPVLEDDTSILRSVIVIFRHGDRNVINTYPNDPYSDIKFWKGGFGQLINKGKQRHYSLGQWYRQRYDGFIPQAYSYYDIRVQSTDVDRTLMSAASHLAGLFPPMTDQIWDSKIDWQPIPIHTTPELEDSVLAMSKPCPKYTELYNQFLQSKVVLDRQELLKETYDYINEHGGGSIQDLERLQDFYDLLFIEEQAGYKLPEWLNTIYPVKLSPHAAYFFSMASNNDDLARLKTGPLIYEIIQHFQNITDHPDIEKPFQRYKIYSAHDTTVVNVLQSMKAYNQLSPPYATSLIFELRQDKTTKKHFVNMLYKNSTVVTDEPFNLKVNKCDFNCDFDEFKEQLKKVTIDPVTWNNECGYTSPAKLS